jgi:hypothetical protein
LIGRAACNNENDRLAVAPCHSQPVCFGTGSVGHSWFDSRAGECLNSPERELFQSFTLSVGTLPLYPYCEQITEETDPKLSTYSYFGSLLC